MESSSAGIQARVFKQFPRVLFPSFLIERGFEDWSYHNDECPRAVRRVRLDGVEYCLTVWVCEQYRTKHGTGIELREETVYTVELYNSTDDEHVLTLCYTDSIDEVCGVVDEQVRLSTPSQFEDNR